MKSNEFRMSKVVRKDGNTIVFADRVAVDKERVGEAAIAAGVVAAIAVTAAHRSSMDSNGYLSNASGAAGMAAVGFAAAVGIGILETERAERLGIEPFTGGSGVRRLNHSERESVTITPYDVESMAPDIDARPSVDHG